MTACRDVASECFDVCGEGVASLVGDAADCLRHLALETLCHFDVPRLLQLVELYAQVARCRACLRLQVDKVRAAGIEED